MGSRTRDRGGGSAGGPVAELSLPRFAILTADLVQTTVKETQIAETQHPMTVGHTIVCAQYKGTRAGFGAGFRAGCGAGFAVGPTRNPELHESSTKSLVKFLLPPDSHAQLCKTASKLWYPPLPN